MADSDTTKRFLEQQRDLGDRDFVFESLLSSEVQSMLRAANRPDWRSSLTKAGMNSDAVPAPAKTAPAAGRQKPGGRSASEDAMSPKKGKVIAESAELFNAAIGSADSLQAIADIVAGCTRCPLHLKAKNPVPGEGNPNAEVVCVGEGPGETEDELGRPFVGKAGALLTKILEAVNLSREEVFITNVVKHRPPGNRNPQPNEVEACSPYLIRQLELIRPKVIIAFGNFAAQTLLNTKDGIGKLRGAVHTYHGTPLVVTYHPAALLRNPNWKRPTWDDVKLARRILDNASGA